MSPLLLFISYFTRVYSKVRAVWWPSDCGHVSVFVALQNSASTPVADCTEREANSRWRYGLTITASAASTYKNHP